MNEENADRISDYLRRNSFERTRVSQYWNSTGYAFYSAANGDLRDQFLYDLRAIFKRFAIEKDKGLPNGCAPQFVLYVEAHGSSNTFSLYRADGSGDSTLVHFSNVIGAIQEYSSEYSDALKDVRFYWLQDSCRSGGMIDATTTGRYYNGVYLPALGWKGLVDSKRIAGVYLTTTTNSQRLSKRRPLHDTATKDFWQGLKGSGDDGDGRSPGDWGDGYAHLVSEDHTDEHQQFPQRLIYPNRTDPLFFPLEGENK